MKKYFLLLIAGLSLSGHAAIEDNSFFIEEAFNQSQGEYQFIQNYSSYTNGEVEYFFQIEAPITHLTHQISFDLARAKSQDAPHSTLTDLAINYRYQVYNQDDKLLTERLSLIVPTGSEKYGTGAGTYGVSLLQSASIGFSESIMSHWNVGGTIFPGDDTLTGFVGGTSIVYFYRDNLNFLVEALFETGQSVALDGVVEDETSFYLNPGLRFAKDYQWGDSQLVPGLSFPLQYSESKISPGLFLYLSFEANLH